MLVKRAISMAVSFAAISLLLLAGPSSLSGQAISLNFVSPPTDGVTPDPAILESGEVAGFFPADNWNNIELQRGGGAANQTLDNMIDNSGTATAADFLYTTTKSHSMFTSDENAPPYEPADKKIFRRYLNQWGDGGYVADFTVTDIPASITATGYDLIVYTSSPAHDDGRTGEFTLDEGVDSTIDQTLYVWDGANPWTGQYVDGGYPTMDDANDAWQDPCVVEGNYIRFNNLTADSFKLTMTPMPIIGTPDRSSICGLQIVGVGSVPDGACGDINHPYPTADLSKDCNVDLVDFSILASHWLYCTDPEPPCSYNPFQ